MDENGTYSWPGGQNTRPKKKPDFKRAGRTVIAVIAALLVLAGAAGAVLALRKRKS